MKPVTFLLLLALAISSCSSDKKPAALTADSVISLSVQAYAHVKSYTDSGKLVQAFATDQPHTSAKLFKTAYVNTGDFNFEYYEAGQSNSLYTINRTNKVVKTWWGINNRTDNPADIARALGAALGVSGGTSMLVPGLLLPADLKNFNFCRSITKPTLSATENVNGDDCYKVIGIRLHSPVTVWIAQKDYLIRKIETSTIIDRSKIAAMARLITTSAQKTKGNPDNKESGTALKTAAITRKVDSIMGKASHGVFTVKSTYLFYPAINNQINPELLTFRPNRQVAM